MVTPREDRLLSLPTPCLQGAREQSCRGSLERPRGCPELWNKPRGAQSNWGNGAATQKVGGEDLLGH